MSQPAEMYPNPVMSTQQPNNSSQPNGSFGPVFIVLAVIVVISAVACVLGRLCSRRHRHVKEAHHRTPKPTKPQQSHPGLGPKQWEPKQKPGYNVRDGGEIELGFDKRAPSAKVPSNGGGRVQPTPYNGGVYRPEVQPKPYNGGVYRPEVQPTPYNGGVYRPEVQPTPYNGGVYRPEVQPTPYNGGVYRPEVQSTPNNGGMYRPEVRFADNV